MTKRSAVILLALLTMLTMMVVRPAPAAADDGYIACMDHAITHKYAMIDDGVSYNVAHAHYLSHTRACYNFFYGGGAYNPEEGAY
jgi:hypothetical protein